MVPFELDIGRGSNNVLLIGTGRFLVIVSHKYYHNILLLQSLSGVYKIITKPKSLEDQTVKLGELIASLKVMPYISG